MTDQSQLEIEKALSAGLDLATMWGLFTYFLYQTPEGKKVREEMNANWAKCVSELQEKKMLKGRTYSLREFCGFVRRELERNPHEQAEAQKKLTRAKRETRPRFKGV